MKKTLDSFQFSPSKVRISQDARRQILGELKNFSLIIRAVPKRTALSRCSLGPLLLISVLCVLVYEALRNLEGIWMIGDLTTFPKMRF